MRIFVQTFLAVTMAALILGGPFAYRSWRERNYRNFRTVTPGVLYRSGQLSPAGLDAICRDYEIRTIITLREAHVPGEPAPDAHEEEFCKKQDIGHFRLPPKCWWSPDGGVPAEENVRKFLEIMDDPNNHPVLIHCFAGAHRTGAYCCIYRMEYERWSTADALDELKRAGYSHLDEEEDVLGYLSSYQPRWKTRATANPARQGGGDSRGERGNTPPP
jgi:tyrosine-protein phosphatase SIW14